MTIELSGAVCVITGAAKGLGAAIARDLHARGANLVIGDIDERDLAAIAQELRATTVKCDVTDRAQVESLAEAAIQAHGRIDVWINNAGMWMPYMPVEEVDFDRARKLMDVNYFGLAYGMIAAMKRMRPRGKGTIVNILSVRSLAGKALGAAYSASKFAAEGFTQAVWGELQGSGIRVVGIYPYRMKTMLFGEHKHDDYETSMEPSEVARLVVDNIASDDPKEHVEIWSATDVRAKNRS